jgi:acyl-CoA thioester hydrolase
VRREINSSLSGKLLDGRHVLAVRVYYEDTDFSGVVYHAGYLRFMERGRTDYLRLKGIDHRAMFEATQDSMTGFAFVVRSMQIEFLKSARMDDVLEIWTQPEDVKGASATLLQKVMRGDETLIEARVRFACVAAGKPRRIPEALRVAMLADVHAR